MYSLVKLWRIPIKANTPQAPPSLFPVLMQSEIGAESCCVPRPRPARSLWWGVDYHRQEERDIDLGYAAFFTSAVQKTPTASLTQWQGSAVHRENIQYSVVGVGLHAGIYTVNALH